MECKVRGFDIILGTPFIKNAQCGLLLYLLCMATWISENLGGM